MKAGHDQGVAASFHRHGDQSSHGSRACGNIRGCRVEQIQAGKQDRNQAAGAYEHQRRQNYRQGNQLKCFKHCRMKCRGHHNPYEHLGNEVQAARHLPVGLHKEFANNDAEHGADKYARRNFQFSADQSANDADAKV